jgi:Protein of unknown function (DUF4240)
MIAPPTKHFDTPQDQAWFWSLIEAKQLHLKSAKTHSSEQNQQISEALGAAPAQASVDFNALLGETVMKLNSIDHLAACYLVNGYLSDDMFNEYCNWVVSKGQSVWARAVEEPDSLADLPDVMSGAEPDAGPECINGDLDLIALAVIEQKIGKDAPLFCYSKKPDGETVDWEKYAWRRSLPRLSTLCTGSMAGLESPGSE